ncbi:N-acetylmuramoyl-L-alanine amidase [Rhizobium leguminosarum bv. viciae]|uniref:peptidoglycan recognition protein family protein n=1 Tax=Rhizobium ruizarguesonis TaxID=2081791 RepID=UPI001038AA18|nr:N-acetylmuramoyl-L-alanine amidase [Rhizobium ruizarguesonis]MBY5806091.1 N-acetylmuramoyl-L-alanine amidase [Rhizobium leguminosarum]TBY53334.1 N-acetylmuramoyl-L-alanine amidase [Rhizobium leguminosarum bv. viciae]MBY5846871.1 N-acetylmuramoyl-L-alanine amidase [Rhizobium leguminosarum]NEH87944.1 hypothetical protein [Rhizobium ruizarguesonis]NEJ58083.1 hypothetical protein [Rhizobium ruizarguesonis]
MSKCDFAKWKKISGPSGSYNGGPFKIVHHTTEGGSAAGAFAAFTSNRSDPHFTVDATTVYQHIDTDEAARALRNAPGGVETNRDSAIQIEVVGFAHRPKTRATLENVRRLCRWIEEKHGVPRVWPNGFPKPAVNGHDPGGHNRDAHTWDAKGGHYGHSNVPENTHWDPGYTKTEIDFLMLDDSEMPAITEGLEGASRFESIPIEDPGLQLDHSRMPDHAEPNGPARKPRGAAAKKGTAKAKSVKGKSNDLPSDAEGSPTKTTSKRKKAPVKKKAEAEES